MASGTVISLPVNHFPQKTEGPEAVERPTGNSRSHAGRPKPPVNEPFVTAEQTGGRLNLHPCGAN